MHAALLNSRMSDVYADRIEPPALSDCRAGACASRRQSLVSAASEIECERVRMDVNHPTSIYHAACNLSTAYLIKK